MVPGEKAPSYCFSGWHLRGGSAAPWLAEAADDPLRGPASRGCRWAWGTFVGVSDPAERKGRGFPAQVCPAILLGRLWMEPSVTITFKAGEWVWMDIALSVHFKGMEDFELGSHLFYNNSDGTKLCSHQTTGTALWKAVPEGYKLNLWLPYHSLVLSFFLVFRAFIPFY